MAKQPLTMLQIRRILHFLEEGYSIRRIARELHSGRNTISGYVSKIENSGKDLSWLQSRTDAELGAILYRNAPCDQTDPRYEYLLGKFDNYQKELGQTGVTKFLLWQEYRVVAPDGYGYSQFCEHLAAYQKKNSATMHFEHEPGEQVQIDFAGKELSYVDLSTGEIISCPVLVCAFPYSGNSYAEALSSARQEHLFPALGRSMSYFGGVPKNVLSDNMRQFVQKSNRYEPVFTEVCEQWSVHYRTNLLAARVRKPKDKPTVENMVNVVYMRIYAPLRKRTFYSLAELNMAIMEQLEIHNRTLFQKRSYSRHERFVEDEQPLLKALPAEPFTLKHTAQAKVQKNYHIILGEDWHNYSVPYQYISKPVKLIYDTTEVEIYLGLQRIATHRRNYRKHGYTTLAEHMPDRHKKYWETKGWDSEYFLNKAKEIGENSFIIMGRVLEARTFTEQAYLSCQGLLRLYSQYGKERFENACNRALPASLVSYRMINNILKNNLDKEPNKNQLSLFSPIPDHDNVRGPKAYS